MATKDEANKVVMIAQEYIPDEKVNEFFTRLHKEVGLQTDDPHLQDFFAFANNIANPPLTPVPIWLWLAFYTLVVVHMILVIGVASSFCLLPFLAPWYIALPLMVFVFFFSTTRVECQLTNLENKMRRRMGMKRIGGFIGHYMVKPARSAILNRKRKTNEVSSSQHVPQISKEYHPVH